MQRREPIPIDAKMNAEQYIRLLLFFLFSGVFVCYASLYLKRAKTQNKRRWWVRPLNQFKKHHNIGFHMNLFKEIKRTDHEQFFMYTRMWPDMFNDLLIRVRPFLQKQGPRRPHSVELKLALTLSFLAHGDSINSKSWEFRIGRSTVYVIVHEVCRALWCALQPEFLPEPDEKKWSEVAKGFSDKWQFPNCVGALDGKHIRIQAPCNSGSHFWNYKKSFSIVLLAICDAYYKFVWVDIGQYGGISDSGVWNNTELAARIREKTAGIPGPRRLPGTEVETNHVLLGDEIFPLDLHLMKPYSKKELNDKQRVFNYRLSRGRNTIENVFGILCARWQILHKCMKFSVNNVDEVVKALVCLHNYIMIREERYQPCQRHYCPQNLIDREDSNHEILEGEWRGMVDTGTLFENIRKMRGNSGSNAAKAQRDVLCEYFVTEVGLKQTPWQYEYVFKNANINIM